MKHHKKGNGKAGKLKFKHPGHGKRRLEKEIIKHSAEVLTCATDTADAFVGVCERSLEELGVDLAYLGVALEIWSEHPELAQPLKRSLQQLRLAMEAQQKSLKLIKQDLESLATDPAPHVHLDPVKRYHPLMRERLIPVRLAASGLSGVS